MSKHEWEYFDFKRMKRCKRCGIATHAQLKFAEVVGCSGSLEAAALDRDAMDDATRRPPVSLPPFGKVADVLEVPRVRRERFETTDYGRYVVDHNTGRKYIAIERYQSVSQVADVLEKEVRGLEARPRVLSRELRERAERAAGRVIAVNFTRAAPDEAIVTHLCEIVERLGGSDVAQLDQENARLRRDLAAMKASRDGWQEQARVWVSTATELRRRLGESGGKDGVTRIEPFPEVKPYDGDWIPPAHRPRIAP